MCESNARTMFRAYGVFVYRSPWVHPAEGGWATRAWVVRELEHRGQPDPSDFSLQQSVPDPFD